MEFIIDYDTRTVLFQSDNEGELQGYIDDNDLRQATGVITHSNDLLDQLTLNEIIDLYRNITLSEPSNKSNPEALVIVLFDEIRGRKFNNYTKAKGKRSIKALSPGAIPKKKKRVTTTRKRVSKPAKKTVRMLRVGIEPNIQDTVFPLWNVLDANFDDMEYSEFMSEYQFQYSISNTVLAAQLEKAITQKYIIVRKENAIS